MDGEGMERAGTARKPQALALRGEGERETNIPLYPMWADGAIWMHKVGAPAPACSPALRGPGGAKSRGPRVSKVWDKASTLSPRGSRFIPHMLKGGSA